MCGKVSWKTPGGLVTVCRKCTHKNAFVPLLHYCCTQCTAVAQLLLHSCCTSVVLLLHSCCTAVAHKNAVVPLLRCCCTAVALLLHCCCTSVVLLLHFCCTAVALLCCTSVAQKSKIEVKILICTTCNTIIFESRLCKFALAWHTKRA
jgi:hypothetical protein